MTFVRKNKQWIIHEFENLIDDLKDEHYSDAEFFLMVDAIREKIKKEIEIWNKQQQDHKFKEKCSICKEEYSIFVLEDYEGKTVCRNCLCKRLICPKCKKGNLIFLRKEEKYCDIHHFHYATHRIFQCNNSHCNNIETNVITLGHCD